MSWLLFSENFELIEWEFRELKVRMEKSQEEDPDSRKMW
jgi:hypothetical protein